MKFARRYFILIALVTAGLGIITLLFPAFINSLFFNPLPNYGLFFIRICGSTLIGYAALNWFTARSHDKELYLVAAWANLVTLLIATVISIVSIPVFDFHPLLLVFQHGLFALGFIYTLHKLK